MVVPKYDEMYNVVLESLSDGKEHNHHKLADEIADKLNLSDEDKSQTIKSGNFLYKNRIGWTRTYLKQAGLIESRRRNHSIITKEGLNVFKSGVYVDNEYLQKYDSFRDFLQRQRKSKKPIKNDTLTTILTNNLTLKCSSCGKENESGSRFCGYCGAKIDESKIYCPVCKTKHSSKFKFCNECGSELVTYSQLNKGSNQISSVNSNLKVSMYSVTKVKKVLDILRDEINSGYIKSDDELKERAKTLEKEFKLQSELLEYVKECTDDKHIINELSKNIKINKITSKEEIKGFIKDKETIYPTIELIEYLLNQTSRKDIQLKIISKIKYGPINSRGQINAEISRLKG